MQELLSDSITDHHWTVCRRKYDRCSWICPSSWIYQSKTVLAVLYPWILHGILLGINMVGIALLAVICVAMYYYFKIADDKEKA